MKHLIRPRLLQVRRPEKVVDLAERSSYNNWLRFSRDMVGK
jgi:hypothetical protein